MHFWDMTDVCCHYPIGPLLNVFGWQVPHPLADDRVNPNNNYYYTTSNNYYYYTKNNYYYYYCNITTTITITILLLNACVGKEYVPFPEPTPHTQIYVFVRWHTRFSGLGKASAVWSFRQCKPAARILGITGANPPLFPGMWIFLLISIDISIKIHININVNIINNTNATISVIIISSMNITTNNDIIVAVLLLSDRLAYTRSPLQDSRLFGPSPWTILATTYEQMGS